MKSSKGSGLKEKVLPKYPVYVPSKGRYDECWAAEMLLRDGVPFHLVVEPQEADEYARFGRERLLVLPWSNLGVGGLIAVRNWIKAHATEAGYERHWQIDDNIRDVKRRYKGRRIPCDAGVGLRVVEDFADRYENVAIAGMNYEMFVINGQRMPPFYLNVRVYSCSLVLNSLPNEWRSAYNDDTDICLQVLADGWCTVLFNAFFVWKKWTMKVEGGNTPHYKGDGRLKMARSLERLWPGVVETKRRFNRPQHVVKDSWKRFDTPLKFRPEYDPETGRNEYGMELVKVREPKSAAVQDIYEGWEGGNDG